jgi:hypothetical protein
LSANTVLVAQVPLKQRLGWPLASVDDLLAHFKVKEGQGRAKTDYLAYEEITA